MVETIPDRWAGKGTLLNRNGRDVVNGSANIGGSVDITAPATPAAQQWAGWGTALKPAWEPICVARKPLSGTVAVNVLEHGTGALNINSCRVAGEGGRHREGEASQDNRYTENGGTNFAMKPGPRGGDPLGRWPANVIHDGSDEVLAAFAQFGDKRSAGNYPSDSTRCNNSIYGKMSGQQGPLYNDAGTAARFFYAAKASRADRAGSRHPTVKPLSLMKYLVKLVTPPGGTVLDPFAGSGTTLQAAMEEGFSAIGIEREAEYVNDIRNRISAARERLGLFAVAAE